MEAKQLFKRRIILTQNIFVELVVWEVSEPVPSSTHLYKYRLALVHEDVCELRYDNEAGKGDHKHIGLHEYPYAFVDVDQLVVDFLQDVRRWQYEHSNP